MGVMRTSILFLVQIVPNKCEVAIEYSTFNLCHSSSNLFYACMCLRW